MSHAHDKTKTIFLICILEKSDSKSERSYQLEVQDQITKNKCNCTLVKSYFKECETNLECRKLNLNQTVIKFGQSGLNMQAVPLAGSIL